MPLVIDSELSEEEAAGPRHDLARQINPSYAQGALVRVAYAANQAEAELIQGMLLEEGIPSMVKRSAGFDVPDMLAAGPRDILVPESGREVARVLVGEADPTRLTVSHTGGPAGASLIRQTFWFGVAVSVALLIVLLLSRAA